MLKLPSYILGQHICIYILDSEIKPLLKVQFTLVSPPDNASPLFVKQGLSQLQFLSRGSRRWGRRIQRREANLQFSLLRLLQYYHRLKGNLKLYIRFNRASSLPKIRK
jgi:hypothetical protein